MEKITLYFLCWFFVARRYLDQFPRPNEDGETTSVTWGREKICRFARRILWSCSSGLPLRLKVMSMFRLPPGSASNGEKRPRRLQYMLQQASLFYRGWCQYSFQQDQQEWNLAEGLKIHASANFCFSPRVVLRFQTHHSLPRFVCASYCKSRSNISRAFPSLPGSNLCSRYRPCETVISCLVSRILHQAGIDERCSDPEEQTGPVGLKFSYLREDQCRVVKWDIWILMIDIKWIVTRMASFSPACCTLVWLSKKKKNTEWKGSP